jgi:hypothetical protein
MTTIDSIETEVTYEAIVHEISQSDNHEMSLILQNGSVNGVKLGPGYLSISYDRITTVTLIDTDPISSTPNDENRDLNMDLSAASSKNFNSFC